MGKDNIDKLIAFVNASGKRHVKVQTAWVDVKSVDWENKTMTATGVLDELDYEGVLLGLGAEFRKPKVASRCLIGIIENNDAATILLHAQEVEVLTFNGGENEGLVKVSEVTKQLNALEKQINDLKQLIASWVPVTNDGGAALKTILSSWAAEAVVQTNKGELQNDKILH